MSAADISVIIRFPHKAIINPLQIGFTSCIRTEAGLLGKPCLSSMKLLLIPYERLLLVLSPSTIYWFGLWFWDSIYRAPTYFRPLCHIFDCFLFFTSEVAMIPWDGHVSVFFCLQSVHTATDSGANKFIINTINNPFWGYAFDVMSNGLVW